MATPCGQTSVPGEGQRVHADRDSRLTVSYTRRMEGKFLANFEQLSKSIHYSKTCRSEFRLVLEVVL